MTKPNPPFELIHADAPVYSRARFLPPSLMEGATVRGSLIADGCRIGKGTVIENSVIGLRCIIGEGATIRNSILMGADFLETPDEIAAAHRAGIPPIGIGPGTLVSGAILDKNCRIGRNVCVQNAANVEESDQFEPCQIRDHIPILVKDGVLPDDWKMS